MKRRWPTTADYYRAATSAHKNADDYETIEVYQKLSYAPADWTFLGASIARSSPRRVTVFDKYLTKLTEIKDAVAAFRLADALEKTSELTRDLANFYRMITGDQPPEFGAPGNNSDAKGDECDKVCAEIDAELNKTRSSAHPTVGLNPLALIAAIKAGVDLFKQLRDLWRQRQNAPTADPV
jgi:hypothetical protein